jgi:hypothetical protein
VGGRSYGGEDGGGGGRGFGVEKGAGTIIPGLVTITNTNWNNKIIILINYQKGIICKILIRIVKD